MPSLNENMDMPDFNIATSSLTNISGDSGGLVPPPPVVNKFKLMGGGDFLLLGGGNFLLFT